MKRCAVIANGYFHCQAMDNQISNIKRALEDKGVFVKVFYTNEFLTYIENSEPKRLLGDVDFVVFLDKDVYISYLLEKAGYKLVNTSRAIELCDDKMKTYVALSNSGVKIPDTLSSPLNYAKKTDELYKDIEKILGYPVVVKEVFGSMGKGVYLAKNHSELLALREKLLSTPHLYQKFVGNGGQDIRVIVIGGKAVGAMRRINDCDFRSNLQLGGRGEKFPLTNDVKELAENAAKVLNLDYCGVDVLQDGDEKFVCEVNSNAFFQGFSQVTGIDVAKLYADYLTEKFYG